MSVAVTPTGGASMSLTFQVKPGYRATITSFSFYNRSTAVDPLTDSTTGYRYWYMTINGVNVGGDTLNRYSVPLLSTGTRVLDNALSALTGTVTVTLHYYRSGNPSGTLRLDNFVLNGFVQQIPTGSMPLTSTEGKSYRYGFNGQERDPEIGEDSYGALYWEYDSRIGRRWNCDPKPVAYESYYAVNRNNPLWNIDPNGDTSNDPGKKERDRKDRIASKKFEKFVTTPLHNLEMKLKQDPKLTDKQIRAQVQAHAKALAERYQHKRWLHWSVGEYRYNTGPGYRSEMTGTTPEHIVTIQAYPKDQQKDANSQNSVMRGDGSLVSTGVFAFASAGSVIKVQFAPAAISNALLVTTQNAQNETFEVARTPGMISGPNSTSSFLYYSTTDITESTAGEVHYQVQNSSASPAVDTWRLIIIISYPLKPTPVIYNGDYYHGIR
ncbi:MAG: hypothetical protein EOO06_10435 [Chitinophagaceae bacterium]|nr:MAG: hypothetical protein EOO06_10435 [Chitinophagaceae bacterium]